MSIGTRMSNRLKRGRSVLARKFAKLAGQKVWFKEIIDETQLCAA